MIKTQKYSTKSNITILKKIIIITIIPSYCQPKKKKKKNPKNYFKNTQHHTHSVYRYLQQKTSSIGQHKVILLPFTSSL